MDERAKKRYEKLKKDTVGYKLNTDEEFVGFLMEGLVANSDRYGIEACPCRIYEGENNEDNMDIVCPCIYRDDDIADFGACYCALYVSEDYDFSPVPERRPSLEERKRLKEEKEKKKEPVSIGSLPYPVYRCEVCGYLSANNNPPPICPICKAKKDRFERFL